MLDGHGGDAGAGGHVDDRPVGEAGVEQVADEDANPVAAHLRDRAVGVAVVHEPLGAVRLGSDSELLGVDRAEHAQDPVGAEAGPAVADAP